MPDFKKAEFEQDDTKKPYAPEKGSSVVSLSLRKQDGDIKGFPYSSLSEWELKENKKLILVYGFSGKTVEIEGRNLRVLENDIRRYRVPILEEKLFSKSGEQDNKEKYNCWIDKITITTSKE